jgi:hypothetical protein
MPRSKSPEPTAKSTSPGATLLTTKWVNRDLTRDERATFDRWRNNPEHDFVAAVGDLVAKGKVTFSTDYKTGVFQAFYFPPVSRFHPGTQCVLTARAKSFGGSVALLIFLNGLLGSDWQDRQSIIDKPEDDLVD